MLGRDSLRCIACLIVLLILVGGQRTAPHAQGQATAAATVPPATPVATAITFGPGAFNLQPTTGLADLGNYQATLYVDFKGNDGGQPSLWTQTLTLLARGKPTARVLTAVFKGKAPAAAYIAPWSADMNGMFYRRTADGACIGKVIETSDVPNASPLVWEPADFLPGVIGAEKAGDKTVNGISAKGYKFDEQALGLAGRAKATGDVWVAEKGGYVLKYSLTLTGGPAYFGEGGDGTLTWTYELTKPGQPPAVALPKDCPEGIVDAPLMQDAQKVQQFPGTTLYTTKSTPAQVAAFYQKELQAAGWKVDREPDISDRGGLLIFKQGDSNLTVIITVRPEGTTVRLVLETARKG